MPNPMPAARRRWQATVIISLFFVAVVAAAGTGWWYARESPPHQGPIVLIAVDSLQARQLRPYDAARSETPVINTPAIDALAADGVLFDRAIAAYGELLRVDTDNSRARLELGATHAAAGNVTAARTTLQEIIASQPGSQAAAEATALLQAIPE